MPFDVYIWLKKKFQNTELNLDIDDKFNIFIVEWNLKKTKFEPLKNLNALLVNINIESF